MVRAAATAVMVCSLAGSAVAHGGVWRPPGGDISQPGGAGAPTTGGRAGTTAGSRKSSPTLDRWDAWWYFQRETYLPRHLAGREGVTTGGGGYLTGRGVAEAKAASVLLPAEARSKVLPILVASLKDKSTEVVDAAAIALGRSVESDAAGPFLGPLTRTLAHDHRSPQQGAVVGLGILGGPEAAAMLRDVALDTPEGRKLCDESGPIDELLRGLAALALGLTNQRENVAMLAALAAAPETSRELAASAVLALGLHRDAAPMAASELVKLLEDPSLEREVRAQVPIALHRLPGTRGLLPKLAALLRIEATPPEVSRSLVIALGNLALPEEAEVVELLITTAKRHSDSATRHLAKLALGRLFERGGAPSDEAKVQRSRVQEWLILELRDPERRANRPFAAIALGLIGRGDLATTPDGKVAALTQFSVRKLEETLDDERDPALRGAVAIALGLMEAKEACGTLRAELAVPDNPAVKSHFATALALLGDRESIPRLRELLQDRSLAPGVRIDVARALGMLGDRDFEKQLLDLLAKAEDLPQSAAFAKALGLLGGREAVEPLVDLARQQDLPEFRRAFAVVALGLLSEKTEMPWNSAYLIDANYTTLLRPLQEVFDIL